MPLADIHTVFEAELQEPTRVFEELATVKTFTDARDFTTDDLCLLEGVLSLIWQAWCRFCRETIIESCLGTHDLSGAIAALPSAHSPAHVSAAAIQVRKGQAVAWTQQNTTLRFEPTWGSIDALLDIIRGLAPANATKLNGMCTLAGSSAKVLQKARNAAAHHNPQTFSELLQLSTSYTTFPTNHACQSLFWVETTTADYLLPQAIQELRDAATHAVV
jgi:hypothetical protein